tara:strand:- start:1042 stop:1971 length:930 start_codon:yes stop_codon:yes gene_type:complete
MNFKKILLIFCALILTLEKTYALENKILFKVDNEIITSVDIYNETKYLKTLNPKVRSLDNKSIFEIAKNSIIKDKIKKIALKENSMNGNIDKKFLEEMMKSIYLKLGIDTLSEFKDFLKINELDINIVENKLKNEILWNQFIYKKFSSKINIDEENIKNEILNYSDKKIKKFLLSEIVFKIEQGENLENKFDKISNEIINKGFDNAASINSISDTSSIGGKIGWVNETSLNKEIKDELSNINIGEYTKPIFTSIGYIILKINDIQEYEEKIDLNNEMKELIKSKTNQQLNQFSNIYFNKIKKDIVINEL